MQKRQLDEGYRLYLAPTDYETLLEIVDEVAIRSDPIHLELILRLGAESGLRISETLSMTLDDVTDPERDDLDGKFLEIYGKDTTGTHEEGKYRKTILTRATVGCIDEFLERFDRDSDEPLLGVPRRTADSWVPKLGEVAAAKTGKEDFEYLTSHDLRAYFATNCLVRHSMNMETVMTVGGWDNYDTMKRYLSLTSDETILNDFREEGLLEGTGWEQYADREPEDGSIYTKIGGTTPIGAAAELSALGADQMARQIETAADVSQEVEDGERTVGRFSAAESQTAITAAKYGAVVGIGAAAIATITTIGSTVGLGIATLMLLLPIAFGWHLS